MPHLPPPCTTYTVLFNIDQIIVCCALNGKEYDSIQYYIIIFVKLKLLIIIIIIKNKVPGYFVLFKCTMGKTLATKTL